MFIFEHVPTIPYYYIQFFHYFLFDSSNLLSFSIYFSICLWKMSMEFIFILNIFVAIHFENFNTYIREICHRQGPCLVVCLLIINCVEKIARNNIMCEWGARNKTEKSERKKKNSFRLEVVIYIRSIFILLLRSFVCSFSWGFSPLLNIFSPPFIVWLAFQLYLMQRRSLLAYWLSSALKMKVLQSLIVHRLSLSLSLSVFLLRFKNWKEWRDGGDISVKIDKMLKPYAQFNCSYGTWVDEYMRASARLALHCKLYLTLMLLSSQDWRQSFASIVYYWNWFLDNGILKQWNKCRKNSEVDTNKSNVYCICYIHIHPWSNKNTFWLELTQNWLKNWH